MQLLARTLSMHMTSLRP